MPYLALAVVALGVWLSTFVLMWRLAGASEAEGEGPWHEAATRDNARFFTVLLAIAISYHLLGIGAGWLILTGAGYGLASTIQEGEADASMPWLAHSNRRRRLAARAIACVTRVSYVVGVALVAVGLVDVFGG